MSDREWHPELGRWVYPGETTLTYEDIAQRATADAAFRDGLLAAAMVCRAQGVDPDSPPCPSGMAAVYVERLASGDLP